MTRPNTSVFGIFREQPDVNNCIDALRAHGFRTTDISVLFPENVGSKDLAHERNTKAPEGAVAGGGSGAIVGAAIGWIAGAGALAVPGLEHLATAGPIVGMLAGMGTGISLGGIVGGIVGSTMPEYEAKRYMGRIRKGGILVSVHCDNAEWVKSAMDILRRCGALDVSSAHESKADFAVGDKPMPRSRVSHTH